jgi:hypothetical protein
MSADGRSGFRRSFAFLAIVATAACTQTPDKSAANDSATASMSKGRMTSMVMPTDMFSGRCGTGVQGIPACLGGLPTLKAGWSGNTVPYDLTDEVAKEIATVVDTFPPGSEVSVPRKPTVKDKKLWVLIESIADANVVSAADILYPAAVARLTYRKGDRDAVDNRYGVTSGGTYYLIVSPESYDGSLDDNARWDIVRITRSVGRPKATVVASGPGFHPCKDPRTGNYHPQKAAPFAWFVNCDMASYMSFEMLIAAKSAFASDSTKRNALIEMVEPDLRASFRMAVENDDLIWITCGLGCCST